MTKVRIGSPGVTVDIEADDPLDDVSAKALQVFRDAGGWPQAGEGPATGFAAPTLRHTPPTQPSGMRWAPAPVRVQGETAPTAAEETP